MQHPRFTSLVRGQTLALPTDDHLLDEALVIVAKARYRRLCLGCIRGGASFFCSMLKLFIPPTYYYRGMIPKVLFNRCLPQWWVKWLIEHSTSNQLLWCIYSFVLRNPQLRQAPKPSAVMFLRHLSINKRTLKPTLYRVDLQRKLLIIAAYLRRITFTFTAAITLDSGKIHLRLQKLDKLYLARN